MATNSNAIREDNPVLVNLRDIPSFFQRPVQIIRTYDRRSLQPDLIAGLTVAVVLLPQAIAYALIAELPPQVGLYTAIVAAIIGALWGSSYHLHTGPTNAASLLVLSILLPLAAPGSPEYIAAAGLMAVMVGVFRLAMGVARLGMLVNFVSDSVVVGFTAGAGVLISVNQLRPLLRLDFPSSPGLVDTVQSVLTHITEIHWPTFVLGLGTMVLIVLLRRFAPKLPGPLIGLVVAAAIVGALGLDQQGINVIGQLPRSLPPLTGLPLLDLDLIGQLSTGALAVAVIGLVEAMSIARSISSQTGQRLDSNQEFVGQGLANIATGFFSGYTGSGSFTRSAVNFNAGGQTPLASVFSGIFVLVAMLVLAPWAAFVPRTSLAAVLILTAYGMIDRQAMVRIWLGTRGDMIIMVVTVLATLLLPLQFAVLTGILFSLALYILNTSIPRVYTVLPDEKFKHFIQKQPSQVSCPQLEIIKISGDLYFGAVNHIEEMIIKQLNKNPDQRFLLLRMQGVNQCDFSGIHMLETIRRTCKERGGDLFLMKVQKPVADFMKSIGFYDELGADHFLGEDEAIDYLFHKILDPAVCIYECNVRAFKECQNLPKRTYPLEIPLHTDLPPDRVIADVAPQELRQLLLNRPNPPLVVDVREPREFNQGHVPEAQLIPLPKMLSDTVDLPVDREIVLVCGSGRRSARAAYALQNKGYEHVRILRGGILAWEAAGMLEAIEENET